MKFVKTAAVILLLALPLSGMAQIPPLADSPVINSAPPAPVGSGARAMGTGGAFIAIADDATAASWNPGGLVQLVLPEMSLAFTSENRSVGGEDVTFSNVNYFSFVFPFSAGGVNIATAINYQRLYDFYFSNDFQVPIHKEVDFAEMADFTVGGPGLANRYSLIYNEQKSGSTDIIGDLGAISPAVAVQITPQFSVGVAWNIWRDGIIGPGYSYKLSSTRTGTVDHPQEDWVDTDGSCTCNGGQVCDTSPGSPTQIIDDPSCLDLQIGGPFPGQNSYNSSYYEEDDVDFEGQNFNVGILWRVSPRWTAGAVYRTEFDAKMVRERKTIANSGAVTVSKAREVMTFPASYGVGASFRYSDSLNFAADVTRIEWNRFMLEDKRGSSFSPVNGLPEKMAEIDPTMTYRVGVEYLIIQPRYVIPIRGGFFYDPEPAQDDPDDYYGVAVGAGIVYDRLIIDLSYWCRWGNDVTLGTSLLQDPVTGAITRIDEETGNISRQMLMLSAILHLQ